MANFPIKIPLDARLDKFNRKYYVAKVEAPISIHCTDGIAFLIFVAESGEEELHICQNDSGKKIPLPQVYKFARQATEEAQVLEDLDKNKK